MQGWSKADKHLISGCPTFSPTLLVEGSHSLNVPYAKAKIGDFSIQIVPNPRFRQDHFF